MRRHSRSTSSQYKVITLAYKIVRFYRDSDKESKTIKTGLTLAEAQEHCTREDTHGDGWFDGYDEE